MKLMFVHGIAQGGKDPDDLKADWLAALERGFRHNGLSMPPGVDVLFPYYGDILDRFVAQMDLPTGAEIAAKGGAVATEDREYLEFRRQLVQDMAKDAGLSSAQVDAEMGGDAAEKGIQNWRWVQAAIRLIDRNVPAVSAYTIEKFLRDVFLYTRRAAVQRAIDKTVIDKLTPEPTLLVSHSLGSVVAYNVLRNNKDKFDIPMLITLGSPLGIRAIRSGLTPLRNPAGKSGWYNAYDRRDVVSLYPLDKANFDVAPEIVNEGGIDNWTENRHTIWGYLDNKNVSKTIHACLAS